MQRPNPMVNRNQNQNQNRNQPLPPSTAALLASIATSFANTYPPHPLSVQIKLLETLKRQFRGSWR